MFTEIGYFNIAFLSISTLPVLYLFFSPAFEPINGVSYSPDKRLKIVGAMLLFMGGAFQLIGVVADFFSSISFS